MSYFKWQAFRPVASLQPVVDCYWIFEQDVESEVTQPQIVLPAPTPALMLHYGPTAAQAPNYPSWVCRHIAHQRLELSCGPEDGLFGITFQPTGFHQLFGMSMARADENGPELAGRPGAFVRALAQRLAGATTNQERAAAAEALLLAEMRPSELPTAMETLAASILLRHGQVSVDELAAQANLCRRQFERRFRAVVGVAPKLFAEISRFRHVVEQLVGQPLVNWQDVTHRCGYFDQAHLIREFRRFTGQTPASYLLHTHGLELDLE